MTTQSQTASLWMETTVGATFPQLTRDISVDVAIAGGGITGLTAALLLQRAGLNVAVIEASHIGSGVTGYTTAHLAEVPDIGYQDLISNFGEDKAKLAASSRRAAIERIAKFVEEELIECQFQRVPGYLYTESQEDVSYLEGEVKAARKLGIDASFTADVPLPFPVKGGVLFPNQGQFHALKYLQGLALAFITAGGYIFEQTRVLDIKGEDPSRVYTELGTVTAKDVILATHMPIHDVSRLQDLLWLTTKAAPYRSYVLGVRLNNSPSPVGLFWDTVDPYHYTRRAADADGEILIVGGEDHKTGEDVDAESCYRRLAEYVRDRFPVKSIDYRWSAQVYEPIDGLPFIGKPSGHSHLYVATGYSGNGLTFGTIAAMLFADAILGSPNPWIDLYDPNRTNIVAGAADFVKENLGVAAHFVGDRFSADAKKLSEVGFNEGKIVDFNGNKLAIYRDERGELYGLKPVCTHAGCIVNWNNAEKSWDCPCHGGRFSPTGDVLNGPPVRDLDQKQIPR